MKAGSLRLRLLLGAAAAIFAAMLMAWLVMFLLFGRHLERRLADELIHNANQLLGALQLSPEGVPVLDDPLSDPRFDLPASGLYWQLSTEAGSVRSRSLWDDALPDTALAGSGPWASRTAPGPFGQQVFLIERWVRTDPAAPPVLVQLAQDQNEVAGIRNTFGRELAMFLTLLWLALVAAAWVQVQLGLHPLKRLRSELAAMQRNPAARLGDHHPREIAPLTQAINELARAREKDLQRARRRAADLAHSLKTPLAALRAQSRRIRERGAADAIDGLDHTIAAAAAAVEAELARSRAAAIRDNAKPVASAPQALAERIVGVVERTEAGAKLVFEVDIPEALRISIDGDDLMELLGALVENAARFARRRVRIGGGAAGEDIFLTVEDDGPGLEISAETALMRGGRLDESGPGHHGLGLAIVRDMIEATGGEIDLGAGDLGGLRVSMLWRGRGAGQGAAEA